MSPIHDQTYRRYQGTRLPVGRSWSVIAWQGMRAMLAKRAFLGLMIFAWIPFIVRCVQLYAVANFPQTASLLGVNAQMFRDFLNQLEWRQLPEGQRKPPRSFCFHDAGYGLAERESVLRVGVRDRHHRRLGEERLQLCL